MNSTKHLLGSHYFIYFGTLGISLPFFNLYCSHLGFTGFEIGMVSSVRTFGVIFFPIIWAIAADRLEARKKILILCLSLSALTWSLLLFTDNFWPILIILAVHSVFFSPVISFIEAFAMEILGIGKKKYGHFRVWGSIGFIAVSTLLGKSLTTISIWVILPLILAGLCLQTLLSLRMPRRSAKKESAFSIQALIRFFSLRTSLFLVIAFLMLASHGAYYGFFSIHLEALGFSTGFIGLAWALASLAEITVMLSAHTFISRFGIKTVLLLSFAAAILRWILLFLFTSPGIILGSQLLHALSYGSFHIASILGIEALSSDGVRTVGQAANNSVTYGAGMMAGFVFCGFFYDAWKEYLFFASALIAFLGGILLLFLNLEENSEKAMP